MLTAAPKRIMGRFVLPGKPCRPKGTEGTRQTLRWTFVLQGSFLQGRQLWNWRQSKPPNKRNYIQGFSVASRLRLLKEIARIDWGAMGPALLITLTYPDEVGFRTYVDRTRDRYLFGRYAEKFLGVKVPMLWRVEWQVRKTGPLAGQLRPHIHLLLFTSRFVPWQEIRSWWRTILHVDGPLATDVRRVGRGELAARYAAKYAAKKDTLTSLDYASYLNSLGRSWGITRKNLMRYARRAEHNAVRKCVVRRVQELVAQVFPRYKPGLDGTFTVLGRWAKILGKEIWENVLPGDSWPPRI